MYVLANWTKTDEGFGPALPEHIDFVLLAEPSSPQGERGVGLFECEPIDNVSKHSAITVVPKELSELIDSAKDYPPALAFARRRIKIGKSKTKRQFLTAYIKTLRELLSAQKSSPYLLVRAVKDEIGYKSAGGFYWVVGYKNRKVKWVSRDYHIYEDSVAHFHVSAKEMERRFK